MLLDQQARLPIEFLPYTDFITHLDDVVGCPVRICIFQISNDSLCSLLCYRDLLLDICTTINPAPMQHPVNALG